jgi:hypothetical protein
MSLNSQNLTEAFDVPVESDWTFCSTKLPCFDFEEDLNSDSSISSSEEERESDRSWIENDLESDCSFTLSQDSESEISEISFDEEEVEDKNLPLKKRKRIDCSDSSDTSDYESGCDSSDCSCRQCVDDNAGNYYPQLEIDLCC